MTVIWNVFAILDTALCWFKGDLTYVSCLRTWQRLITMHTVRSFEMFSIKIIAYLHACNIYMYIDLGYASIVPYGYGAAVAFITPGIFTNFIWSMLSSILSMHIGALWNFVKVQRNVECIGLAFRHSVSLLVRNVWRLLLEILNMDWAEGFWLSFPHHSSVSIFRRFKRLKSFWRKWLSRRYMGL